MANSPRPLGSRRPKFNRVFPLSDAATRIHRLVIYVTCADQQFRLQSAKSPHSVSTMPPKKNGASKNQGKKSARPPKENADQPPTLKIEPLPRPSEPSSSASAGEAGLNTTIFEDVRANLIVILDHDVFQGIETAVPLPIQAGQGRHSGHMATFNIDEYKTAMVERGHYKAACNIFNLDFHWTATPKVPIRRSAIQQIKAHYFQAPGIYPEDVVVGIGAGQDPTSLHGRLRSISPEEIRFALIDAMAGAVTRNEPLETLQEWRTTCLTCCFHFKLIESDDDFFMQAMQLREHVVVDFHGMARTARQWVYLVVSLQKQMASTVGSMSPADLAAHISSQVTLSPDTERVTENFVKTALDIHSGMFAVPAHCRILEEAEEEWGMNNPFNSIAKLHIIWKACRGHPDDMSWVLKMMVFSVRAGLHHVATFTCRTLKGENNHPGHVQLFLLKKEMRIHLLTKTLTTVRFAPEVFAQMMEVYGNLDRYVKHLGPIGCMRDRDLSWQSSWPPSALQFSRLVEDIVYGKEYDATLRFGLRGRKTVEESSTWRKSQRSWNKSRKICNKRLMRSTAMRQSQSTTMRRQTRLKMSKPRRISRWTRNC